MNKETKRVLNLFQCDFNRSIEENFAQVLSENEKIRLFFINENEAFTDGQNIVVDPAVGGVFADTGALRKTEDYLRVRHVISGDLWNALRIITRGQNIHECLHILYTDFPLKSITDTRSTTKAREKTLALIANIIEDAFIEAAGCSVFDNLELYLKFHKIALLFCNMPVDGTVDRTFQGENSGDTELRPLSAYLNYMGTFLLYPMVQQAAPPESIAEYVARTKQLFLDGSICGEPDERHTFSQQVFDIIESLIPETADEIDGSYLKKMLTGAKTHSGGAKAISNIESKGRTAAISRRLFTDIEGNEIPDVDYNRQLSVLAEEYSKDKKAALKIVLSQPVVVSWKGEQFDCHNIHKGIEIIETKPKPDLYLRKAYQNVYDKYRININSYNSRFSQLLKARIPAREEHRLFGAGISSRYLADVRKRFWYRKEEELGIPDISVLLLIDGSGSMEGAQRSSAVVSSVILHEVLKKQNITHAIVEHRAIYNKPTVKHNILVDFAAGDEEKYNILTLSAEQGTREGLSLFWAEKYICCNTVEKQKLIIAVSDGVPAHGIDGDGCYLPPISIKDTANAAAKIIKRGTDIIAVALESDESNGCYDALSKIYPSVVSCTDLRHLTGKLLGIVSKHLN